MYEIDNLSLRFSLELRGGVTKMICYENDIYVAGTDGLLSCIDVRTGEVLREYGGNTSTILDLDVSRYPDQPTRLLIGTEDQKIYIYEKYVKALYKYIWRCTNKKFRTRTNLKNSTRSIIFRNHPKIPIRVLVKFIFSAWIFIPLNLLNDNHIICIYS